MAHPDSPRILFASTNKGKLAEVQLVAERLAFEVVSADEVAGGSDGIPEVVENADTYRGNAQLKADAFFAWSGLPSLADDAGLEVDALNGAPGVWSARYAGEPANSEHNVKKMLAALGGQKNRRARFVSFLFARIDEQSILTAEAFLPGNIIEQSRGSGGFGYDGIFVPEGYVKTLSEIKDDGSLRLHFKTHRILALEKILPEISRALAGGVPRTMR